MRRHELTRSSRHYLHRSRRIAGNKLELLRLTHLHLFHHHLLLVLAIILLLQLELCILNVVRRPHSLNLHQLRLSVNEVRGRHWDRLNVLILNGNVLTVWNHLMVLDLLQHHLVLVRLEDRVRLVRRRALHVRRMPGVRWRILHRGGLVGKGGRGLTDVRVRLVLHRRLPCGIVLWGRVWSHLGKSLMLGRLDLQVRRLGLNLILHCRVCHCRRRILLNILRNRKIFFLVF